MTQHTVLKFATAKWAAQDQQIHSKQVMSTSYIESMQNFVP